MEKSSRLVSILVLSLVSVVRADPEWDKLLEKLSNSINSVQCLIDNQDQVTKCYNAIKELAPNDDDKPLQMCCKMDSYLNCVTAVAKMKCDNTTTAIESLQQLVEAQRTILCQNRDNFWTCLGTGWKVVLIMTIVILVIAILACCCCCCCS